MTPKEKAIEFRDRFRIFVGTSKGDEGETINNYLVGKKEARLAAIILCDAVISEMLSIIGVERQFWTEDERDKYNYWIQVKTEIENL